MKNKGKVVLLIVLIALVIGGSSYLYRRLSMDAAPGTKETAPETPVQTAGSPSAGVSADSGAGAPAPAFTVYDADGNEVTFRSFLGKPVVVNFWASWCGPCQSELPSYQKAYEKYGEEINFMMVDLTGGGNDSMEDAQRLISDSGYSFPVYYDNDNDAAIQYSIRSIPLSCFITADGTVQNLHIGAMGEEDLTSEIEALLPAA